MTLLHNKIALITGASSGIGEACAHRLAADGARLILTARRENRLQELANTLQKQHGVTCLALTLDVCDKQAVANTIDQLPSTWQDIDILVNNAGLALSTDPIHTGHEENWDKMIDTNIKGLLYVSRKILPGMVTRGQGHVINIGSVAGIECYPAGNVYAATKHAVNAISKSMRMDLAGTGIRVSEVSPGAVETEFSEVRWQDKERARLFYHDFNPLLAEDIADAVHYCLTRPQHVDIAQMLIMPTAQASATMINRSGRS